MGYDNNFNEYYDELKKSGGNKRAILLIYPVVTNQNDEHTFNWSHNFISKNFK